MEFPTIKRFTLAIYTSIAGALVFYSIYRIYVFFHFIEKELLKPAFSYLAEDIQRGWISEVLFLLLVLFCSFIWSLVYYMFFKNSHTVFTGIISGLFILWILLLLGWMYELRIDPTSLEGRTIVSLHSLFILYGLFTGYSISYQEPYREKDSEQ